MKRYWDALPGNVKGSLWLLASAILFTVVGVLAKLLGQKYDALQIAFFRALAGTVLTLPFLMRGGIAAFGTKQPLLQVLRTLLASTAIVANFYALVHLPLADANAISFSRGLFMVPLAVIFLSEIIGMRRISATVVGFVGILIILRPGIQMEWASLAAVAGAFAVAAASVCVKVLLRTDSLLTLLFYSGTATSLILAIPAFLVWRPPDVLDWILLAILGTVAVLAQGAFIRAFDVGEATALAPVDYTRILFAGIAGYFVFGDVPDTWSWVGIAIVIGSTLYITVREAQLGKHEPPQPPIAPRDTPPLRR